MKKYYYIVSKDKFFEGYKDDGSPLLEKKRGESTWYFETFDLANEEAETAKLKKYVIKSIWI